VGGAMLSRIVQKAEELPPPAPAAPSRCPPVDDWVYDIDTRKTALPTRSHCAELDFVPTCIEFPLRR